MSGQSLVDNLMVMVGYTILVCFIIVKVFKALYRIKVRVI